MGSAGARWAANPRETMTKDWDEVSFVISSSYRVTTLKHLAEVPATPSKIAAEESIGIAHVSRALQELRERSLAELLVSEDRNKGRVYGITDKGRTVWTTIEAENLA